MEHAHARALPLPVSNARSRHLQRRDRPSRSLRRRANRPWSRVDREETVLTSAAACSNPSLVEHVTKIKCGYSRFNQRGSRLGPGLAPTALNANFGTLRSVSLQLLIGGRRFVGAQTVFCERCFTD